MRKQKHLTPEQVKKVVAEVDEWNGELAEILVVRWVTHLWEIPGEYYLGEYYLIHYENRQTDVFHRLKNKKLVAVRRTTYFGPHWTDNPHYKEPGQEEQAKPEE